MRVFLYRHGEADENYPESNRSLTEKGICQVNKLAQIIEDREDAIRAAVALAQDGDTVLVLGKGHETGQDIAGAVTPFDDRIVLAQAIEAKP